MQTYTATIRSPQGGTEAVQIQARSVGEARDTLAGFYPGRTVEVWTDAPANPYRAALERIEAAAWMQDNRAELPERLRGPIEAARALLRDGVPQDAEPDPDAAAWLESLHPRHDTPEEAAAAREDAEWLEEVHGKPAAGLTDAQVGASVRALPGDTTPGPWHAQQVGTPGYFVVCDAVGAKVPMAGPKGEANARLLSSAPAMLNALQRLTHPAADDSDVEHALAVIRAARGVL